MKKLVFLFGFLVLAFGCSKEDNPPLPEDTDNDKTQQQPVVSTPVTPKPKPTPKPEPEPEPQERIRSSEPKKDAPRPKVRQQDFEIEANGNGLVIKSFRGQQINKVVSKSPVQNLTFDDEFLIYDEKTGETWTSKTINLSAYAEYLQQE